MKKVSYCTVCYGRLWQLALTIQDNLKNLKQDEELILIDYNSPDDTMIYILGTKIFNKYIRQGQLKFAHIFDIDEYNCPKSKNIAHRLGDGEILVNLDADNFLLGMREKIDNTFNKNINSVLHMETRMGDGSFGRIALSKENFYKIGGYDENLLPHSHQDSDLINRGKGFGLEYVFDPLYTYTIANNMHAKNKYLKESWFEMREKNKKKSQENVSKKLFVANINNGWGKAKLMVNKSESIIEFNPIFPENTNILV
jgi:hypothetical protein